MVSSCGWFPMSHKQIADWLERHPEALPRTLDDLARYPMAFRRVMVNRVAHDVRVRLWREHLETFLRPDAGLTEEQQQMVQTALPDLEGIFAAGPAPNPVMTEFERRMSTVF